LRKFLKPGDEPKAVFHVSNDLTDGIKAREYCNKHGLWKS
ncbi:MAG: desulfoferrodoxin family protein, partial [Promethearchaeota archaeon]